jgi:hypothetical protein
MNWFKIMLVTLLGIYIWNVDANAQYMDNDGQLACQWGQPTFGSEILKEYLLAYTVNGVDSSIVVVDLTIQEDSTIVLANIGDWAVVEVRSISIFDDTSVAVISDTAYYNEGTGIGPPNGVIWK